MKMNIDINDFENVSDKGRGYFNFHRGRYEYCIPKIIKRSNGKNVIDVGSKYLLQSSYLAREGFDVCAYDTKKVIENKVVRERAENEGVDLRKLGDLSEGEVALNEERDKFDILIMSEVIEHLAFNPVKMWRSLFRVLRPGGKIFISTPNSVSLEKRVVESARILTGVGRGVAVDGIIETPTYGHHWKEYSISELYRYFDRLGVEEKFIDVNTYNYRPYSDQEDFQSIAKNILRSIGNIFYNLSDEIFLEINMPDTKTKLEDVESYV
ncbi:class I SAM-dependent methyltransferase [Salinibacter ruber]|uniref:class I SAM-dependent methyltransferase n=1 Tax=Salinibacter ruber TaxID=146919 RepID=UPI002072CC57|nr:methyltransferase domain-containing protein [Salinibacter ruber]